MAKGIRPFVTAKFLELAPKRVAGEFGPIDQPLAKGNTEFRRSVMQLAIDEFGISVASASTAYNTAFKKISAEKPDLTAGLGRPEDKKGGRKPGSKNNAAPAASTENDTISAVADGVEAEGGQEPVAEVQPQVQAEQPAETAPEGWGKVDTSVEDPVEAVALYKVIKTKDGSVVAENISETEANEMVDKAAKAKKAKLQAVPV